MSASQLISVALQGMMELNKGFNLKPEDYESIADGLVNILVANGYMIEGLAQS